MYVIKNNGRRRLGIPGRPAIILEVGKTAAVNGEQLTEMKRNRTFEHWVQTGVISVNDQQSKDKSEPQAFAPKPEPPLQPPPTRVDYDKRIEEPLPDGVTGSGTELHDVGGGWWSVYVNGFKVTDKNVRKKKAEQIAKEYE